MHSKIAKRISENTADETKEKVSMNVNDLMKMNSTERFKCWFNSLSTEEQLIEICNKSNEVKRNYKAFQNAQNSLNDFGLNRTGKRGGKFTSLQSRVDVCSYKLNVALDELKIMTRNIDL